MKAVKFLLLFCGVILLNNFYAGIAVGQIPEVEQKVPDAQGTVSKDAFNNQLPAQKETSEKYRIGFQDTLEIQVFRHPELNQVVSVSPDGTILMPRIDKPIVAVCRTERELSAFIGTLYQNYLRNPFVNVRVAEQRSQPFAVIGAVEKPGSFYLNRRIRLLELLAFAGGPKVEKAGSKIQVARVGNVSGCSESQDENAKVEFLSFKVKEVLEGGENPWMQPGDIVSVLEAEEAYVVGNVIKPTKISLKEPVTLTQAIAIGGGLAPEAKTNKVVIQRQGANNSLTTETVYDLKDIRDKKIPDPVLLANDIVSVPKDGVKSIRNGLIKALSSGVGGLFYGL